MGFDFSDLDQRLFGFLWKAAKGAVKPKPGAGLVTFEDVEPTVAMLASVVAQRPMRARATEDRGGPNGDVLRLPARIAWFESASDNRDLYTLRTALDAALAETGVVCGAEVDADVAAFAAVLHVPSLLGALGTELPGIARIAERLFPPTLERLEALAAASARSSRSARSPRSQALLAAYRFAVAPHTSAPSPLTEEDRAALLDPVPRAAVVAAFRVARRLALARGRGDTFRDSGPPLVGAWPSAANALEMTEAPLPPTGSESGSERKAPPRDGVRRVELPDEDKDGNPVVHSFEKLHTAENYAGGKKDVDGEDELDDHADALEELDLHEVIRTPQRARSTYRMELDAAVVAAAPAAEPQPDVGVAYDEWDGRAYREGFCRVFTEPVGPARASARHLEPPAEEVARVRAMFESLEDVRRPCPRSPSGSEVDLDALVDRYATVRAGFDAGDRVYVERRRVENDVATLLLLDVSSSSDGWVQGRHVLELERWAALCIGDALDTLRSPFAIAGFNSNTHRDCRFVDVKSFATPWRVGRGRVAGLAPAGYTRIGPAIRHATSLLADVDARRRALLIVTDGRPTDYDRYEGKYGVDDVRKAIVEAERVGVTPFAVCIADSRASHLRAMFGAGGYEVLARVEDLTGALGAAEARFRR